MITIHISHIIHTNNMSCLDETTCAADRRFTRINCNFTITHTQYVCNPINTCARLDGLYDCCAENINDCVIVQFDIRLLPTVAPTKSPSSISACEITCNLTPTTNECYWYESQNTDISCMNEDDRYCCSHDRAECCYTYIQSVYITFGSIFLLCLCVAYKYIVCKYTRVVPMKPPPEPELEL
jgi:hypothetical protein